MVINAVSAVLDAMNKSYRGEMSVEEYLGFFDEREKLCKNWMYTCFELARKGNTLVLAELRVPHIYVVAVEREDNARLFVEWFKRVYEVFYDQLDPRLLFNLINDYAEAIERESGRTCR
ncbi:MAG: hypothetical protein QXQ73_03110, partial [Desulfurococcaceae archaeon]